MEATTTIKSMSKIITIILFLHINLSIWAQVIDLKRDNKYNSFGKKEESKGYPDFKDTVSLTPLWIIHFDQSESINSTCGPEIYQGLAFSIYSLFYAVDINTGEKVYFGTPQIQSRLTKEIHIAFATKDSTHLINPHSGKRLKTFKSNGIQSIEFITGGTYYFTQRQGIFAYSMKEDRIIWSMQDRYSFYKLIRPFENGCFVNKSYYNFMTDSIAESIVYIKNGALAKQLNGLEAEARNIILDNGALFIYNDREMHAIDIASWKKIWSLKGNIGQKFILHGKSLISANFEIDKKTGRATQTSDVGWLSYNLSIWENNLLRDANAGELTRKFITTNANENFKMVFEKSSFPFCLEDDLAESLNLKWVEQSTYAQGVTILSCDEKLYLIGIKPVNKREAK